MSVSLKRISPRWRVAKFRNRRRSRLSPRLLMLCRRLGVTVTPEIERRLIVARKIAATIQPPPFLAELQAAGLPIPDPLSTRLMP